MDGQRGTGMGTRIAAAVTPVTVRGYRAARGVHRGLMTEPRHFGMHFEPFLRWSGGRSRSAWASSLGLAVLFAGLAPPDPALADLKLCNSTSSRVGVAIGYLDKEGWATEGWWNIASQTCETLLKGAVPSRYVYVHAVDYDRGGEWAGKNAMCTDDKSFAIRGVQDCRQRGYKETGFFEVDTGEAKEWTVRLTDPERPAADK